MLCLLFAKINLKHKKCNWIKTIKCSLCVVLSETKKHINESLKNSHNFMVSGCILNFLPLFFGVHPSISPSDLFQWQKNLGRTTSDSMVCSQRETENREATHRTLTHFTTLLRHTLTTLNTTINTSSTTLLAFLSSACVWDDFEVFFFVRGIQITCPQMRNDGACWVELDPMYCR